MNADELRAWLLEKLQEEMPRPTPPIGSPITEEDCDLLYLWMQSQILARLLTPELCARLAVIEDRAVFTTESAFQEIVAELDAIQEASLADVADGGEEFVDLTKLRLWLRHPDLPKPPQ